MIRVSFTIHSPLCLCIVFAMLFLLGTVTSDSCGQLSELFNQKAVKLTGVLDKHLYIIAKGSLQQVYDIPVTQVSSNRINFNSVTSTSLNTKWPSIASRLSQFTTSSYNNPWVAINIDGSPSFWFTETVTNGETLTVVLASIGQKNSAITSKNYDSPQWSQLTNAGNIWISAEDLNTFYLFTSIGGFSSYSVTSGPNITQNAKELKMCSQGDQVKFILETANATCQPRVWNDLLAGFSYKHKIHLFGKKKVYIFDKNMTDNASLGTLFTLAEYHYDSYFVCPVASTTEQHNTNKNNNRRDFSVTPKTGSKAVLIIVIVVVVILALVGAIVGWLYFRSSGDDKEKSPLAGGGGSSDVLPKGSGSSFTSQFSKGTSLQQSLKLSKQSLNAKPTDLTAASSQKKKISGSSKNTTKTSATKKKRSTKKKSSKKSAKKAKKKGSSKKVGKSSKRSMKGKHQSSSKRRSNKKTVQSAKSSKKGALSSAKNSKKRCSTRSSKK